MFTDSPPLHHHPRSTSTAIPEIDRIGTRFAFSENRYYICAMTTDERRNLAFIAADIIRAGNPTPREISDAIGLPYSTYTALLTGDDEFARIIGEARRERTDELIASARKGLSALIAGAVDESEEEGENHKGPYRKTRRTKFAPDYRAVALVLTSIDPEFSAAASAPKAGAVSFNFEEELIEKTE